MKCEQCGNEFEAKRSTAKYCSDGCRKLAFQDKRVSVPDEAVSVADHVSVLDSREAGQLEACQKLSPQEAEQLGAKCLACDREQRLSEEPVECTHEWYWNRKWGLHHEQYHEAMC